MTERTFHRDYVPLAETLYRIAFYMLESRAEAEDAVQELFLKLWETRDRLPVPVPAAVVPDSVIKLR